MADDVEDVEEVLVPPDGGFGWVIVVCVFFITFLSFGIIYSVGIMFDVLMADFKCSISEITIVASIALCMQCFLGPFVSLLQRRFSTRLMVVTGVVIISLGFILSAFAPTIFVLYFTFGVLGGLGMALIYLPVTVMVSFYFCRRRSLATALGGIGSYVGCFVHPYLIRFLISIYNWRGAIFILGALELNSLAAALLLRPVPVRKSKKAKPEQVAEATELPVSPLNVPQSDSSNALAAFIEENIAGCKLPDTNVDEVNETQPSVRTLSDSDDVQLNVSGSVADVGRTSSASMRVPSAETLPPLIQKSSSPAPRLPSFTRRQFSQGQRPSTSSVRRKAAGQRQMSEQPQRPSAIRNDPERVSLRPKLSVSSKLLEEEQQQQQQQPSFMRTVSKLSRLSSFHNLYTSDVLPPDLMAVAGELGPSVFIPPPSRQRSRVSDAVGKIHEEILLEDVKEAAETSPTTAEAHKPSMSTWQSFVSFIGLYFYHFKDAKFTSFFTTNLMKGLIYYTPSMFIVGWGKQLGMSVEETTLLISLVGIGNIFGRPVMAFISDILASHRLALLALMVGINGTVTVSTVLFPNFYYLAFFVFQFAFLIGGGQTLLTPILADMVPLSELGLAFGILIAAEGAAILVGPPLLGLFPTYPSTFAASGLILLSSGVVLIVVAYVERIFNFLCRCVRGSKSPAAVKPDVMTTVDT